MRFSKVLFVLFMLALLSFTTIYREVYVVKFDHGVIEPEKVYEGVERYAVTHGFSLERRIEETVPEKRTVSSLLFGAPYRGGVFLTLIRHDNGQVELEGVRLRGGCSPTYEIETMRKFNDGLVRHLAADVGVAVTVEPKSPYES